MHRVGADPAELLGIVASRGGAAVAALRGAVDHFPVADGRERGPVLHRGQIRSSRRGPRPPGARRARPAHASTPRTRPGRSRTPRPASTWCGAGSRCTGSRRSRCSTPCSPASWTAPARGGLRPVLSLRAKVTLVRELDAEERPSYGRLSALGPRSTVATVPLGYADGVPRRYFTGGRYRARGWAGAARWPGWSRWTRSWWTAAPTRRGGRRRRGAHRRAGSRVAHRDGVGGRCSAPSRTRCSAASGRGCRVCRSTGRDADERQATAVPEPRSCAAWPPGPAPRIGARGGRRSTGSWPAPGPPPRTSRRRASTVPDDCTSTSSTPTTAAPSTSSSAARARRWCCCTGSC